MDVRPIDANALIRKIEDGVWLQIEDGYGRAIGREKLNPDFAFVINEMPTIDAQPVKHGKWTEYSRNALETYIECSNCCIASRPIHLQMVTKDGSGLPDFCPNCGADMREEAHNVD